MMFWFGSGMDAWSYLLLTASTVLFWGLMAVGTFLLVRYLERGDLPPAAAFTAEQMLAERFALGEIDEPEFRRRLDVLVGGYVSGPPR